MPHADRPRRSANAEVYRRVKEGILDGSIASGDLISEGEISERFGCSRTPVREAFLRLEAEGWMRLYPKRGALVVPISPEEREHVLGARRVVEHAAAVAIFERGSAQELVEVLNGLVDQQVEQARRGDRGASALADVDFHRAIVAQLGNPIVESFYDSLRERQRRIVSVVVGDHAGRAARAIAGHRALVEALAENDPARFAAELDEHLRLALVQSASMP